MYTANFSFERALWTHGFSAVAGVDEAGTGAWAGPVVAGAVILPSALRSPLLRDSKLLSPQQREAAMTHLVARGACIGIGIVTLAEVNTMQIRAASLLAMARAVAKLTMVPDAVLVDAFRIPHMTIPQRAVVHGDRIVKSIAAASIVAKVTRDRLMRAFDAEDARYGFAAHKGYGTKAHQTALQRLGPSALHRVRFAPVARALRGTVETGDHLC